MIFGSWAIITGFICLFGFSYLFYASLSEKSVEKSAENSESDS